MREWEVLLQGCRGADLQPGSSCLTGSALESGLAKPQGPIRNKEHGKGCDRRGWSKGRAAAHAPAAPTAWEEGEDEGDSRLRVLNEHSPAAKARQLFYLETLDKRLGFRKREYEL